MDCSFQQFVVEFRNLSTEKGGLYISTCAIQFKLLIGINKGCYSIK